MSYNVDEEEKGIYLKHFVKTYSSISDAKVMEGMLEAAPQIGLQIFILAAAPEQGSK